MMQSLRQIKRRIKSVENTGKLTRALEMISISKLRPLQDKLPYMRDYFSAADRVLNNFLGVLKPQDHPLMEVRKEKRATLCLFTSDTGLCGSYNVDIIRLANDFMTQRGAGTVNLVAVGKKGFTHFKKMGYPVFDAFVDSMGRYNRPLSDRIAARLMELFLRHEADEVYVAYTRFDSAARHTPLVEKLLGIPVPAVKPLPYKTEPDREELVDAFLPFYIFSRMRFMMLNSFASEHSARGMAMGESTDNAKEMLEGLILLRNKIRQANITREIIEVISSSDAMKGS